MIRIRPLLLALAALIACAASLTRADEAKVHAVLFYSPTCPHCHKVIDEDLPPLLERFGERLVLIGVNVMIPEGQTLFNRVMEHFGIPRDDWGVPALVIGDRLLQGGREIPESLAELVQQGLARGGIDWPGFAGLRAVLSAKELAARSAPAASDTPAAPGFELEATLGQKIARDPIGNGLSILVLVGMLLSLPGIARQWRAGTSYDKETPRWSILLLALLGLGVAGYLSYVEVGQVAAVCGPVGDCNTVQQSPYARLFGLIPAALLGLAGYAAIGASWLLRAFGPARFRHLASLALWALALTGTLFSIWFTFLEPFVIGATCLWCLTSAVLMTALLWLANGPAIGAWHQLRSAARTGPGGA